MNYIILNNKKSTEIKGLLICSLPPISKPAKKVNQEEIDGVDGDIITELGYKAYDKEISIGLTYNYNVDEVIEYFDSEGTVVFSNEPDKYYKYKIIEQIDLEKLIRFKTATVTMHVQPFKYLIDEENIGFEEGLKTATGNPIYLEGSSNGKSKIVVKGNVEQNGEPTPEAPIEVVTVGQNVNLFDKDNANIVGLYIAKSGDTTLTQGTKAKSLCLECKPNTTYTIQKISGKALAVGDTEEIPTTSSVLHGAIRNDSTSITITTGENAKYLIVYYNNGSESVTDQQLLDSIKVEIGSKATSYSSYGESNIEINVVNKNWLNLETLVTKTQNGITLTKNEDGSYTLNGTASTSFGINVTIDLSLNKGTYTHSIGNTYKKGMYISLDNLSSTSIGNNSNNSRVFTIDENKTYTKYVIWIESGTQFNNFEVYPMIELGTTATSYKQHEKQIVALPIQKEMLKIGDVEDTFIKQDGKWYEAHNIAKIIADGTNITWYKAGVNTVDRYSTKDILGKYGGKTLCTHFKYANGTDEIGTMWLSSASSQLYLNFAEYDTSTIADLNTWLAEQYANGTPVEIYYELNEPELIECTTEQEEILNSFHTYEGATHISASGIANLEVTYCRSVENIIDNIGNTNAKPVFTLYGEGDITVNLNGQQIFAIALGDEEHITIDIERMEAYKDNISVLKNRLVTGNYDNFVLKKGRNIISFDGLVSTFRISNYSRWI